MQETLKLAFFGVRQCGYYRKGSEQPGFCPLPESLRHLMAWVKGHSKLGATLTFMPPESTDDGRVYCLDVETSSANGDYVFATWNETASLDGATASVRESSPIGRPTIEEVTFKAGSIPGFPTYFWFIPEHGLLASVRVRRRQQAHGNMMRYVRGFLTHFSPHCVTNGEPSLTDMEVLGYSVDGDTPREKYRPRFSFRRLRNAGQEQYLRQHRAEITAIVSRAEIPFTASVKSGPLAVFLDRIGLGDVSGPTLASPNEPFRVTCAISHTPDALELDKILADWFQDQHAPWENLGFRLENQPRVFWLKRALVSEERTADLPVRDGGYYAAKDLLRVLSQHRVALLKTALAHGE